MAEVPHWEDEIHGAIKDLISYVGEQMPHLTTRAAHPRQMAAAYLARMRRLVLGIDVLYDAALPDVLGGVLRIAYETWATGMWVLCIGDEAAKLIDADYVIQTNRLIERLDMDIDIIPELEGVPQLPKLWKRIEALEKHLVEEGVSKAGDLDITHKIVYGGESGMGVHAGFTSVVRCVSTFLRRFLHRFSESVTSSPGWLIHATAGRAGGVGILRTNRSGCSA